MGDLADRYDRLAPRYDRASKAMGLLGFRDRHYHRVARDMLDPQAGETVVVPGVGTGLDLPGLSRRVGPTGRVVGIDISVGMLEQARRRIEAEGLVNVDLVHGDAADVAWPSCDRVLANFTLEFQPRFRDVLDAAGKALRQGGRIVVAALEVPGPLRWLAWPLVAPFGHTPHSLARRPIDALAQRVPIAASRRFYGRLVRIAAGGTPG